MALARIMETRILQISGLLLGYLLAQRLFGIRGIDSAKASSLLIWAVPLAFLGGKLGHLVETSQSLSASALQSPGYSLFGAFGAVLSFWLLWSRVQDFPVLTFLDCVTPAAALGLVFFRLSCFWSGCCGGSVCELPWGVRFPPATPSHTFQVGQSLIAPSAPLSLPAHPTQLYEASFGLIACLGLLQLVRRNVTPGGVFWAGTLSYGIFRLGNDFLRADRLDCLLPWGLTSAQSIGLLLVVVSLLEMYRNGGHLNP